MRTAAVARGIVRKNRRGLTLRLHLIYDLEKFNIYLGAK